MSSFEVGRATMKGRKSGHFGGPAILTAWQTTVKAKQQPRKRSALDLYVREKFHETPATLPLAKRRKLMNERWKALNDEDRAVFKAKANAETDLHWGSQLDYLELRNSGCGQHLGKWARGTARRKAALVTLGKVRQHPAYSAGLHLGGYGTGLRAELVTDKSKQDVAEECRNLFNFDPVVTENPWKQSMQPKEVCKIKHVGLCPKDPEFRLATNATKNMQKVFVENKLLEKAAMLVKLAVQGGCNIQHHYFFSRFIGKVGLLVKARYLRTFPMAVYGLHCDNEGRAIATTTNLAFSDLLTKAARSQHCPVGDFKTCTITCYGSSRAVVDGMHCFAVREDCVLLEASLDLSSAGKKAKQAEELLPFGLSMLLPALDVPKSTVKEKAELAKPNIGDASDASGDELVQLEHEPEMEGDEPSSCDGESDNADEPQED